MKVEISKRASLRIARTALRKCFGEGGDAFDRFLEWNLVGEQHISHQRVDVTVELETNGIVRLRVVLDDSRFPADPREVVRHLSLMLERHQCDDVTNRAQIARWSKPSDQVGQVLLAGCVENIGLVGIRSYCVGTIELLATLGVDVPATPTIFERRALIADNRALSLRHSQRAGKHRADKHARHTQRSWPLVALQTYVATGKRRRARLVDIKSVEDDSLFGIGRSHFETFTASHVADSNVVREVNRSRVRGRDRRRLKTSL